MATTTSVTQTTRVTQTNQMAQITQAGDRQHASTVPMVPIQPAAAAARPQRVVQTAAPATATSHGPVLLWLATHFRLPDRATARPGAGYVAGLSLWSMLVGLLGCAVCVRAGIAVLGGVGWWYQPAVALPGLAGCVLAAAAFTAVPHRRLPWQLLGGATGLFAIAAVVAFAAAG